MSNRINVIETDEYGQTYLTGWFDAGAAEMINEGKRFDGHNMISLATGSQWDHESLWHTAGGRWVLESNSQYQSPPTTYRFVTDEEAKTWLGKNDDNRNLARFWPEDPDEGGETPRRTLRISEELWGQVQNRAAATGRTATSLVLDAIRQELAQ